MENNKINCCCGEGKKELDIKSKTIKEFYDSAAEGVGIYTKDVDKFSPDGPTEEIVSRLLESNKTKVLDIGCGMGTTLMRVAQEHKIGELFIGLDFSEKMIQRAKEGREGLPQDIKKKLGFFTADICEIPYMDQQFDFIYVECVLNLVQNREKALNEISRVLAPGGIFCYTDFISKKTVPTEIKEDLGLVSGCRAGSITMDENIVYLKKAFFQNIEVFDYSYEKKKRYTELLKDNPEAQKQVEYFAEKNPFAATFLEEEIGYYVVVGVKQ